MISDLRAGLLLGRMRSLFSEWPIYLRSSGHHRFSTVLETPMFRVVYEPSQKQVQRVLSRRREYPVSKISTPVLRGFIRVLRLLNKEMAKLIRRQRYSFAFSQRLSLGGSKRTLSAIKRHSISSIRSLRLPGRARQKAHLDQGSSPF